MKPAFVLLCYLAGEPAGMLHFSSVNNCDSIIRTNLIVSESLNCEINNNNDSLEVTGMGGNPPYSFNWINGDTNQIILPQSNGLYWAVISDINGCFSDTCFMFVDWLSTSVLEQELGNVFIYPNPSTNIFNITINSKINSLYQLKIFNSVGELIYDEQVIQNNNKSYHQIDLDKHPMGVYMLDIITDFGSISKKLILK